MTRPPEQAHLPADGMAPPPEPDNESVKTAIYAWLDLKTQAKRISEDTKAAHLAAIASLDAAGLDWHPFLDPTTQKKRRFWVKQERKAATTTVPKPPKERKRKKRGGPDKSADAEIPEDDTVETRKVPRGKEHDKVTDPFAGTRAGMNGNGAV